MTGIPTDSYEVTEISVPDPYVVSDEPTQTIWLEAGDSKELIFDNLKQPTLKISKEIIDWGVEFLKYLLEPNKPQFSFT